jgi:ubiquinone biosynthesis protein COQ4
MQPEEAVPLSEAHRALGSLRDDAARGRSGHLLARVRRSEAGRALLRDHPSLDPHTCDLQDLLRLPRGTFGYEYARWMRDNGFHSENHIAPTNALEEAGESDQQYLCERILETHDFWHVLTGYNCDAAGELGLLAFTLGQTGAPGIKRILARVLAREVEDGWRHGHRIRSPLIQYLMRAWNRGRRARLLVPIDVEDYLILPLDSVRQRLAIDPVEEPLTPDALPPISVPA